MFNFKKRKSEMDEYRLSLTLSLESKVMMLENRVRILEGVIKTARSTSKILLDHFGLEVEETKATLKLVKKK